MTCLCTATTKIHYTSLEEKEIMSFMTWAIKLKKHLKLQLSHSGLIIMNNRTRLKLFTMLYLNYILVYIVCCTCTYLVASSSIAESKSPHIASIPEADLEKEREGKARKEPVSGILHQSMWRCKAQEVVTRASLQRKCLRVLAFTRAKHLVTLKKLQRLRPSHNPKRVVLVLFISQPWFLFQCVVTKEQLHPRHTTSFAWIAFPDSGEAFRHLHPYRHSSLLEMELSQLSLNAGPL